MPLFRQLIANSANKDDLQLFVVNNIHLFHDLYNSHYTVILDEKNDIRDFIESKRGLLENIDYSFSQTKAFISILFDFCERFGFISIVSIENTLRKKDLYLGKRREAAKLFLLNIRQNQDYLDRFTQICKLIQCSIETEEDSEIKPIITFSNYLAKVIRDTSDQYISSLKTIIKQHVTDYSIPFLRHHVINQICSVDTTDIDEANSQVQAIIEKYLGHSIVLVPDIEEITEDILIEEDTDYYNQLVNVPISFGVIRQIAVQRCNNSNANLPGRGVNPLRSEMEMFIYLKRYGNMHKSKLLSALNRLPFEGIDNPVEIIDWGCGQGLASLVLIDYLKENRINLDISKIILIEPSELSLKRAALHVTLSQNTFIVKTICSVFNSLSAGDVLTNNNHTKIHLFSNVLDIDETLFSQSNLIRLIEQSQSGSNYFACVSPYINDEKTDRVEAFQRHFENNYDSFEKLLEKSNSGRIEDEYWNCNNNFNGNLGVFCTHPECGCDNKWTRVIRLFKVIL